MISKLIKFKFGKYALARLLWLRSMVCLFCLFPAMAQTPIVSEYKLDNGIRVLIAPRPGCGAIHAAWFVEGGRWDTGDYPPETADLLLAAWFADSGPTAISAALGMWMKASAGGISSGRDIAAGALEAWCSAEMRRFMQVLRQEQIDSARRFLQSQWQEPDPMAELHAMMPNGNNFTAYVQKNVASLVSISTADLQALAGKYAVADRVMIVLVGDVEDTQAISILNACFGPLAHSDAHSSKPVDAPQSNVSGQRPPEERKREISSKTRTEVLTVWPVPLSLNDNKPSLELFAEILAGGPDSGLTRHLVSELGYSDSVQTSVSVSRYSTSLFVIRADVTEGHTVHEVESAIQSEVQRSLHYRLQDTEINRAAQRLETKYALRLADAPGMAQALIDAHENIGDWGLIERTPGGVNLEPQVLTFVLRSIFQPESSYSLLLEQDPIRSPRSLEEARLVSLLARLLENNVSDPTQRESIIRETVRQFGQTPRETRGQLFSLLEARVGH